MNDLNADFAYFKAHHDELVERFNKRWIVIKDEKVVGDYDTQLEALEDARGRFELGTFLIQFVEQSDQSYSQTFHSRVTV